jgi:NADPH-dependent 2,4-dienoyl-CoA reductase/sulfur reductase-like enzyme/nitrite reductase/ring-hydroxylating ferredoxin subunit
MSEQEKVVAHKDELHDGEMKEIIIGENKILLSCIDGKYYATGASCTHYGAPLSTGVLKNNKVVCPWHHASFDLTNGNNGDPPALDDLSTFPVRIKNDDVIVELPDSFSGRQTHKMSSYNPDKDDRTFVILGAGAAGEAAAETLRKENFEGRILMITRENRLPYDRPNLSKEYLSGDAPYEWMPLRSADFYEKADIEIMHKEVSEVDIQNREILFTDNKKLKFDRLLMATGGRPRKLNVPGSDLKNIHVLRTFDDADSILKSIENASKAVIIGASFIGLEAAASLIKQGLDVTVVAPEAVPFERIFGKEIGKWIQQTHEENGVTFKLNSQVKNFKGDSSVSKVTLDDDSGLDADFVLIGIGVEPVTDYLIDFDLNEDRSINVNTNLKAAEHVFAAGDIARYPDFRTGDKIRIEHWRLAQQQGRIAAHNMLDHNVPFKRIPFFWTDQAKAHLLYVGHVQKWDDLIIDGEVSSGDFMAYFVKDDKILAAATTNREKEIAAIQELMQFNLMPKPAKVQKDRIDALHELTQATV